MSTPSFAQVRTLRPGSDDEATYGPMTMASQGDIVRRHVSDAAANGRVVRGEADPNLFPNENMEGKIDRPEEYVDIATKCVSNFREKNRDRCLVILSRNDEALNSSRAAELLHHYYEIVWDEEQTHKFKNISPHLQRIKAFKTLG